MYNDPLPRNDSSESSVGLNDLGSAKSDWGLRNKSHKKTQTVHKFLLNSIRNNENSISDRSSVSSSNDRLPNYLNSEQSTKSDAPVRTGSIDNYVVYSSRHPGAPLKKTPISLPADSQTVAQDPLDPTSIMDAARRFLEDVTFNAIVNYYGQGTESAKDVSCKATIRYQRNPIVQHYCSTTCIQDKFKCPALLCACSASNKLDSSHERTAVTSKPAKNKVSKHGLNEGHLKTFVNNLIDKNRLLESELAPRDFSNIPEKYIRSNRQKLASAANDYTPVKSAVRVKPMLGRVKVAAFGKPTPNNSPTAQYSVSGSSTTQDQSYFNKLMQEHISSKETSSNDAAKTTENAFNTVTYLEPAHVPSKVSLFNIQSGTNSNMFNTFIKSTIQKTDIANTKLAPSSSSSANSKVIPQVMSCTATGEFSSNPFMNNWCMTNCPFGFCPPNVCLCNNA